MTQPRRRPSSQASRQPDAELLERLRGSDIGALGEIYDRHAQAMWRAARRVLGADEDADDVLHAVFLKLPDLARSFDGRAHAAPWLVGVTVRLALRHRRSAARFFKMLARFGDATSVTYADTPEAHSSRREELHAFEAAFRLLSPKKRAVFALFELDGLTTDEIATSLEVPAATVRTRLHHARLELYAALGKRGA